MDDREIQSKFQELRDSINQTYLNTIRIRDLIGDDLDEEEYKISKEIFGELDDEEEKKEKSPKEVNVKKKNKND